MANLDDVKLVWEAPSLLFGIFEYRMVRNFCEGFIKTARLLLSSCKASEPRFNPANFKLSSRPNSNRSLSASVSLKPSSKSKSYVAQTHEFGSRTGQLRKAKGIVSTNVLSTRLVFSLHWNKEPRLPSLSVNNSRHFAHLLTVPLAITSGPQIHRPRK